MHLVLAPWLLVFSQQVDVEQVLERADKLLEEAKGLYEKARTESSVPAYVDAGFKLEEARIKCIVVQEVGSSEKQKAAADRLRAINQLGKLIHDGKVAISGTPADPGASKSPDPPPTKEVAPEPTAQLPPVDVSKRAPVPDAARQKEAEKLIRDLFKEDYAKKSAADRKALAQKLLKQAADTRDDFPGLWVLFREAQDVALQAGDLRTALGAIESAAKLFDIDSMSLRASALASAAKTAKSPDDFAAIAGALDKLIEEFVAVDQFDAAEKAAAQAVAQARKANDPALLARSNTRSKEVAEAKALYQSMKGVLETLAKSPDDPGANLEMGRFLCFVKGSWDLGLRFIVKSTDSTLKPLAEKELANPPTSAERSALADGWADLSEKEKSPLRKSQL